MQGEFLGVVGIGLLVFLILLFICYIIFIPTKIASSEYDSSYKWAVIRRKRSSVKRKQISKPNPPTHVPIIKSLFGLDLKTRWLPSLVETIRVQREGVLLLSEIRKELGQLGFHLSEEEESMSSTHFHKRVRAGGRVVETGDNVIVTLDFEEISKSQGCVVVIQVHCKDNSVSQILLENVKHLLWQ